MTTIHDLRAALMGIPRSLLGADERRVQEEALTSLDALSTFDVIPASVAVVGSSGSGKSSLVNAWAGAEISPVSQVRPTTQHVIMVGSSGPITVPVESEYAHVPSAPSGIVFVDTPSWEHDNGAVESAIAAANLVVVVLTPSRYADAEVARLVENLPDRKPSAVLLNRVDATSAEEARLIESVRSIYGAQVVVLREGADMSPAADELIDGLKIDTLGYQRGAVLRASAAAGARHLAGAVTSMAIEIGDLAEAIDHANTDEAKPFVFTLLEDWPSTRDRLVHETSTRVSGLDAALAIDDPGELASRIRGGLEPWDSEALTDDANRWREATTSMFVSSATIRWRRGSGRELIGRNAWRMAMHPGIAVPARVRRMLGSNLDRCSASGHDGLVTLIDSAVEARRQQWAATAASLGEYTPGTLLSVADGFAPRAVLDG